MRRDAKSKAAVVLKLLEEGDTMLCLDARHTGVAVPPQHANNPSLRLVLNLNFPYPIEVTDEGIRANLAFGGRRFACYVPMDALWAVFNPETMQGMMWPESMPSEVHDELTAQKNQAAPDTPVASSAAQQTSSGVHEGQGRTSRGGTEAAKANPRQQGHLRIVK